ncbi:MAG: ACP S-malonyltransferase [Legionellales bacterium]|nr:ACP S-malonyltransferase [Legionellales bacterium]
MAFSKSLAFVFPGQGSQHLGMLAELSASYSIVRETFQQASDALGYDVLNLSLEGPEELLNKTAYTQPALLTAGVAVYRVLESLMPIHPAMMAGHSLGEYTALVCAGSLDFVDAVRLVSERGQLMQSAVLDGVGAMGAIIGLDNEQVALLCDEAAQGEVVSPANINAIGQVVVSGHRHAVERTLVLAKESGAKIAKLIPVSVPSHCALMKPAAEKFIASLTRTKFRPPNCPLYHNVDVQMHSDPEKIRQVLAAQLYRPVQWVETIQVFAQKGVRVIFELGPNNVLTGLIKRIDKRIDTLAIYDEKTLRQALYSAQSQSEVFDISSANHLDSL